MQNTAKQHWQAKGTNLHEHSVPEVFARFQKLLFVFENFRLHSHTHVLTQVGHFFRRKVWIEVSCPAFFGIMFSQESDGMKMGNLGSYLMEKDDKDFIICVEDQQFQVSLCFSSQCFYYVH